jgi:hypothetical protein
MIADSARFATLTAFDAGQLLGFAVKLLDLPTEAAHILDDQRVVLSHLVGDDKVRALRRQHDPENFHLVISRKPFDFDDFALVLFSFCPCQMIYALVRFCAPRIIHLAIILERTIVDFVQVFDLEHDVFGRIPAIHQHRPKIQFFLIDSIQKHVLQMIQFGLSIPVRIINPVVDHPELVYFGIDVDTRYDPHPVDQAMRIPAVLLAHQFDLGGKVLIDHRVIKHQKPKRGRNDILFDILPDQVRSDGIPRLIAVRQVMTEFLAVFRVMGQCVIGLAHQQVLTIIQPSHAFFFRFHALTLPLDSSFVNGPVLRKSYN